MQDTKLFFFYVETLYMTREIKSDTRPTSLFYDYFNLAVSHINLTFFSPPVFSQAKRKTLSPPGAWQPPWLPCPHLFSSFFSCLLLFLFFFFPSPSQLSKGSPFPLPVLTLPLVGSLEKWVFTFSLWVYPPLWDYCFFLYVFLFCRLLLL